MEFSCGHLLQENLLKSKSDNPILIFGSVCLEKNNSNDFLRTQYINTFLHDF